MVTTVVFNQAALKALETGPEVRKFVGDRGDEVAERANAKAEQLFEDQGGGGVGSLESKVESDEDGVHAVITYPAEHFYMWFGELGTSHQRPRPHVRPALFAKQSGAAAPSSAEEGNG